MKKLKVAVLEKVSCEDPQKIPWFVDGVSPYEETISSVSIRPAATENDPQPEPAEAGGHSLD